MRLSRRGGCGARSVGLYGRTWSRSFELLEKKMNTKHLILAAAAFAASGPILADQMEYTVPDAGFVSTKTRAEVMAELKQA